MTRHLGKQEGGLPPSATHCVLLGVVRELMTAVEVLGSGNGRDPRCKLASWFGQVQVP